MNQERMPRAGDTTHLANACAGSPLDYGMLSLASYFEPSELERVMPLLFPADKGMRPPNVVPYAYAPHRAAASGVPVSWPFACLHFCVRLHSCACSLPAGPPPRILCARSRRFECSACNVGMRPERRSCVLRAYTGMCMYTDDAFCPRGGTATGSRTSELTRALQQEHLTTASLHGQRAGEEWQAQTPFGKACAVAHVRPWRARRRMCSGLNSSFRTGT